MLRNATVTAFIATARLQAAREFYATTLGLQLLEDTPFAMVFDAGGTTLRLQKVDELKPAAHTVLGWYVADINATMDGLVGAGVVFERFETLPQDESGVWTTPDKTKVAWFKDPDGNLLSLTEQ